MTTLRLATRKSPLALRQANQVKQALEAAHSGLQIQILEFVTQGDRIQNRPLADIGGKGLFIKRLEEALVNNEADFAVHSLKDVPPLLDSLFCLPATLQRDSPFDAFVSEKYLSLQTLPQGASIGTCSVRRRAAILHFRPDLHILPIRGNVDSRLKRMTQGEFDALILAEAGLTRLNHQAAIRHILPIDLCMPSVGQGVIAIECLTHASFLPLFAPINHLKTFTCITAERSMNAHLGASCVSPVGSYATLKNDILCLQGVIWTPDGQNKITTLQEGLPKDATLLGERAAYALKSSAHTTLFKE